MSFGYKHLWAHVRSEWKEISETDWPSELRQDVEAGSLQAASDFVKISRIVQSIIILFISLSHLNIEFTFFRVCCLILMLISSIVVFFSVFLLMASYCFITIHGLEVRNLLTDGGKQMAQYPIGIFRKGFIFIFSFIIPYASVNYYPLLYLLGRTNNILYLLSPLLVVIYLIPCFISFNIGLKHYSSTGS